MLIVLLETYLWNSGMILVLVWFCTLRQHFWPYKVPTTIFLNIPAVEISTGTKFAPLFWCSFLVFLTISIRSKHGTWLLRQIRKRRSHCYTKNLVKPEIHSWRATTTVSNKPKIYSRNLESTRHPARRWRVVGISNGVILRTLGLRKGHSRKRILFQWYKSRSFTGRCFCSCI